MTGSEQKRLIVAIAVNIAAGQAAAATLGFPRWAGTVTAGAAMAAASQPQNLSPLVRGAVDLIVLPGRIASDVLTKQAKVSCCAPCSNNEPCVNQGSKQ